VTALPAKAAILGAGVIGSGWLARLIENGVTCTVYDPAPNAEAKIAPVLENAERAMAALLDAPRRGRGAWSMAGSIAEAVDGAELIVEAVPERLDIKHAAYAEIDATNASAIIASSTSGFRPSVLKEPMAHPERLIVGHPFNPVYLLPLVEVVGAGRRIRR
jgi:carnitine 3-dehydrogenase